MNLFDFTIKNLIQKLIKFQNHCIYYHQLYFAKNREKTFIELISNYLKIQNKLIPVKQYTVYFSEEIKQQLIELDVSKVRAVQAIKSALENGKPVIEWQSKTIFNIESDSMLNNWGLYHFHLGMKQKKNDIDHNIKFRERTGKLLIAYIDDIDNKAYFLTISNKHGKNELPKNLEFARKQYMEILDNNWNHILLPFKTKNLSSQFVTDEQRASLFNKNVNLFEEVNGITLIPHNLGQMTNGTRIEDFLWIRNCLLFLRDYSHLQNELSYYKKTYVYELY